MNCLGPQTPEHNTVVSQGKNNSNCSIMSTPPDFEDLHAEEMKAFDAFTREVQPKIITIFIAYLQPLSNISTAAREITQLHPALRQPRASEIVVIVFLERLWELFITAVEQMPWWYPSQNKIIELIKAIRDTPGGRR